MILQNKVIIIGRLIANLQNNAKATTIYRNVEGILEFLK